MEPKQNYSSDESDELKKLKTELLEKENQIKKLKKANELSQLFIHNTNVPIVLVNLKGIVQKANALWSSQFNLSPDECIEQSL